MDERNVALGTFLRSRRERLKPENDANRRARRRTPGLRREEVAEAAGISPEWYIKLEQGRAATPSVATVNALARALQLDAAEHLHLRHLARGEREEPFRREAIPGALKRLVERLEQPAYVTNQRWDALAWNTSLADVFIDLDAVAVEDQNILLLMCTDPRLKTVFGDEWVEEARRIVATFRAAYDRHVGEPAFEILVKRLLATCQEFEEWWRDHEVRSQSFRVKTLRTQAGKRRYTVMTFQASDVSSLRLTIFMPAD